MEAEDQQGFVADGFEVVAVVRGGGVAAERTRIWTRSDPGCPATCPGVGSDIEAITPGPVEPIAADYLPAGCRPTGE